MKSLLQAASWLQRQEELRNQQRLEEQRNRQQQQLPARCRRPKALEP